MTGNDNASGRDAAETMRSERLFEELSKCQEAAVYNEASLSEAGLEEVDAREPLFQRVAAAAAHPQSTDSVDSELEGLD